MDYLFIFYLATPWSTLGFSQKDSLMKPILISVFCSTLDTKVIRSLITSEQLLGMPLLGTQSLCLEILWIIWGMLFFVFATVLSDNIFSVKTFSTKDIYHFV